MITKLGTFMQDWKDDFNYMLDAAKPKSGFDYALGILTPNGYGLYKGRQAGSDLAAKYRQRRTAQSLQP